MPRGAPRRAVRLCGTAPIVFRYSATGLCIARQHAVEGDEGVPGEARYAQRDGDSTGTRPAPCREGETPISMQRPPFQVSCGEIHVTQMNPNATMATREPIARIVVRRQRDDRHAGEPACGGVAPAGSPEIETTANITTPRPRNQNSRGNCERSGEARGRRGVRARWPGHDRKDQAAQDADRRTACTRRLATEVGRPAREPTAGRGGGPGRGRWRSRDRSSSCLPPQPLTQDAGRAEEQER